MAKSQDYRRFAEEWLKLANGTQDPQIRATYSQMARVWFRSAARETPSA